MSESEADERYLWVLTAKKNQFGRCIGYRAATLGTQANIYICDAIFVFSTKSWEKVQKTSLRDEKCLILPLARGIHTKEKEKMILEYPASISIFYSETIRASFYIEWQGRGRKLKIYFSHNESAVIKP
jgi:hypothetical protein